MNTINISADATAQRIGIGNQYENLATAVVFDCSKFAEDHGAGTAQVVHRRPTESIGYVCTDVAQEGNTVTWLVTDDDTSFTGKGLVQLRWYVDDVLRESVIFPTYILPSVTSSDDAPADVKSALEQLMEYIKDNTISTEDLDERIANYFYDHPLPMEGEADGLVAGSAKQLLSDSYTLDQVPYLFRKSPDSDRAVEEIVGGTVVWNQMCNSASVTVTSGHKYYMIKGGVKSIGASTGTAITGLTSGADIVTDLTTMFGTTIADYIYSLEQSTAGAGVAKLKEWGFFTEDYYPYCEPTLKSVEGLVRKNTVGFNQWDEEWEVGSINNATGENTTSGTNRIRSKNYIPCLPNTAYCLYNGSNIKTMFYFYDSDKNFIAMGSQGTTQPRIDTSPLNAHYLRFRTDDNYGTTYKNDICINLSDPSRNGTYEPYEKHSYPLDSSLELMGIPKLSDGKMYFDGDEYSSDGQVVRRYGIVDLGTLTWYYNSVEDHKRFTAIINSVGVLDNKFANILTSKYTTAHYYDVFNNNVDKAIALTTTGVQLAVYDSAYTSAADFKSAMSGVMLVYELATPTTETAQPFHNPQIVGDTEEFVTTGLVPVGHSTKYYQNLRKKIENLPWNFSDLIAPTEVTNKATRNYTAGSYLILNNTLYKVTSNIANGGTITPNTNCTATTIMAEFMSL